jgi:two-component system CheB/CheR fusion protein
MAINFTSDGEQVSVRSHIVVFAFVIEVIDTGVGIDPALLPHVFDAFVQAEQSGGRELGGLGLGLAISKTLVELHGGSITARSAGEGTGATFTVRLPIVPSAADQSHGVVSSFYHTGSRSGARILVVDDHHDTVSVMRLLLERRGYQVFTAHSMRSALEVASDPGFDLLISDIGLPDGSGFDLIERLTTRGPVNAIAISGFGSEEDVRRSLEAGFREHLTKPITLHHLHDVIDRMLG